MWQKVAIKQGKSFLHHVVPAIVKPLLSLWNQVIGFLFVCMGTIFGFAAVRSFNKGDIPRFLCTLAGAVIMTCFGVSSFWRARKISRS